MPKRVRPHGLRRIFARRRANGSSEDFAVVADSGVSGLAVGAEVPCVRFVIRPLSATCWTRHM